MKLNGRAGSGLLVASNQSKSGDLLESPPKGQDRSGYHVLCYSSYLTLQKCGEGQALDMYTAVTASDPKWPGSIERAVKRKEFSRNLNRRIRQCRLDIKKVEEELRSTKAQFRKMIQEIENLTATKTKPRGDAVLRHSTGSKNEVMSGAEKQERAEASSRKGKEVAVPLQVDDLERSRGLPVHESPLGAHSHEHEAQECVLDNASTLQFANSTSRFTKRLEEISTEFDSMMGQCRTSSEELTFTRELFMAELSRQEVERSRQEAKASRVIAFVAMLYLPMTTAATIFAMPVFNFQSHWLDDHFNF
ncbi:hypothetical protein B0T22DRAFT_514316 [Podospora appendiculata]|uniref:Uncharacterized protein n=1 Tax=Podospora appendiculata TaxID=314037 RepID=A0AAE1CDR3_9PEZI|nr:hypothetical protein B0T22DRAFT_514316 [Podospora appendiculata]